MALIDSSGFSHVRLTVTEIGRSKEFYDRLFGWQIVIDASGDVGPDDERTPANFFGGVLYRTPQGTMFGLRPVGTDRFDPQRTGLDHVSFAVRSVDELERVAAALTAEAIEHGEITRLERSGIAILSLQDPDGINLELTAPLE